MKHSLLALFAVVASTLIPLGSAATGAVRNADATDPFSLPIADGPAYSIYPIDLLPQRVQVRRVEIDKRYIYFQFAVVRYTDAYMDNVDTTIFPPPFQDSLPLLNISVYSRHPKGLPTTLKLLSARITKGRTSWAPLMITDETSKSRAFQYAYASDGLDSFLPGDKLTITLTYSVGGKKKTVTIRGVDVTVPIFIFQPTDD